MIAVTGHEIHYLPYFQKVAGHCLNQAVTTASYSSSNTSNDEDDNNEIRIGVMTTLMMTISKVYLFMTQ